MNSDEKAILYGLIQKAVMEDPGIVKLVMEAVNDGILTAAEEARERAQDFEAVAMMAVTFNRNKKLNAHLEKVIRSKVKEHKRHLCFVWDDFLEKKDEI